MIIVTGATGQLGRAIVEQLVALVPAGQVGASVRDPQQAADLMALGVRVRRGDFAEPATLAAAFEGATQVLIVSSNARASGGDPLAQHRSAIDAVHAAGAHGIRRRRCYRFPISPEEPRNAAAHRRVMATNLVGLIAVVGCTWNPFVQVL